MYIYSHLITINPRHLLVHYASKGSSFSRAAYPSPNPLHSSLHPQFMKAAAPYDPDIFFNQTIVHARAKPFTDQWVAGPQADLNARETFEAIMAALRDNAGDDSGIQVRIYVMCPQMLCSCERIPQQILNFLEFIEFDHATIFLHIHRILPPRWPIGSRTSTRGLGHVSSAVPSTWASSSGFDGSCIRASTLPS